MSQIDVKVPAVGESITEATIGSWLKKTGDFVKQGEEILSLDTDKASVEVVAEQSGQLETLVAEGDTVEIGAVIAKINTAAVAAASAASHSSPSSPTSSTAQVQAAPSPTLDRSPNANHLSPAVQRIVSTENLNPETIPGSGKGRRITKEDALKAVSQSTTGTASQTLPTPPIPPAPPTVPEAPKTIQPDATSKAQTKDGVRVEKMSRLRQTIARNLKEVQQTAAILTTFNEVNMRPVMDIRSKYKDAFKEKHGVSLGFMGFFVKACCHALQSFPAVNAVIKGDELHYFESVHMGIAVGTEKGLMVPVIRQAQAMGVAEIEMAIRNFATKARDGKIGVDDLTGGTFTITNGGVYGSLMSTPILNPGQSAILGMHKIEDRPVVLDGEIVVRPMMYLALSYDHRIIDGKEAVSFLVSVKDHLEDPVRLLLEI